MSENPWIKFYPSDFIAGAAGLSLAEKGVYITILMMIYENDGPIIRNDKRLSRVCGTSPSSFKKCLEELIAQNKITETNGNLSNCRADFELKERRQKRELASQSAIARWKKKQENQQKQDKDASKTHTKTPCETDAARARSPEPELDKEKRGANTPPKNGAGKSKLIKQATRISNEWKLTPELETMAIKVVEDYYNKPACADDLFWIANRAKTFVDYWRGVGGQKGTKLDWNATWRNSVRYGLDKRKANGNGKHQNSSRYGNQQDDAKDRINAIFDTVNELSGRRMS